MSQPDVTVVICTYNRAAMLADALSSLLELRVDDFHYEVLVVDNGSTDNTAEVVQSALATAPVPLRYVCEQRPGVAAARNRGIAEAAGSWIAFCDDDQLADPGWLCELLKLARTKRARIVGGAVQLIRDDARRTALPTRLEAVLAPGGRRATVGLFTPRDALNSGNQMAHRDVFEQVGGYDESWKDGGSDTDFFSRVHAAGIDAWYTPRAIVHHLVPDYRLTPAYLRWLSLRRGWGLARNEAGQRGLAAALLLGVLRCLKGGLEIGPWLVAWTIGDLDEAIYCQCQLWRTQGYARFVLSGLLPGVFPQHEFRQWIKFRGEREQFAAAPGLLANLTKTPAGGHTA